MGFARCRAAAGGGWAVVQPAGAADAAVVVVVAAAVVAAFFELPQAGRRATPASRRATRFNPQPRPYARV